MFFTAKVETFINSTVQNNFDKEILNTLNSLIRDIEVYQLLSKINNSFYTYLPFNWQYLRDGNICIKKGKEDKDSISYYCRINLDLEKFGSLSTLIMFHNYEFIIFFKIEDQELQKVFHRNCKALYEAFYSSGLNLKGVNFLKETESLEQIEELINDHSFKIII